MEKKKIIVRSYKSGDAQDLARIYYNTIHEVNAKDYSEIQLDAWAPKSSIETEGWSKKFAKSNPFVAVIDETLVGFAEFEPNGHIDCFYCHHEWIGFGVGKALMNAIHENAGNNNISKIFAEVSITARPFFEKHGFTVTEKQKVSIDGKELINFKMEKVLNQN
ncbi:MAG: GNAT family N-acetyltransferase [Parachlamydiaceae bacterium]|nr:GNAT family N-acetyltransferase [Parachlamydiaceae bacterium]